LLYLIIHKAQPNRLTAERWQFNVIHTQPQTKQKCKLPACPRLTDGDSTPAPSNVSKNVH